MRSRWAVLSFAALLGTSSSLSAADALTGYKGIPWGTDCGEARSQLATKGIVFNASPGRSVTETSRYIFEIVTMFAPECGGDEFVQPFMAYDGLVSHKSYLLADAIDFYVTAICRDDRFVGIYLQTSSEEAAGTLRRAAGNPTKTKNWRSALGLRGRFHRLSGRGDSARYMREMWGATHPDDPPTVGYFVFEKTENDRLLSSLKRCAAAGDRDDERNRLNTKRRHDAVVE